MRKGKGDKFMKTVYVCFYLSNGYAGCDDEHYFKIQNNGTFAHFLF